MPCYVCKGAMLKCSMGSSPSNLEVIHPSGPVNIQGNNMAGIMDNKPMVNIKAFGQCNSIANPAVASATAANMGKLQPMPCMPNTVTPWINGKTDVLVQSFPALTTDSKLMCMWAGTIEITDDGQAPKNVKD